MSNYSNGPGNVPRLPGRVVDTLINSADVEDFTPRGSQLDRLRGLVHATCEELLARLPGAAPSPVEYTVNDSELARKIMVFLGRATSGSMEPGADPLRDRLAERIALWRPAAPAVEPSAEKVADEFSIDNIAGLPDLMETWATVPRGLAAAAVWRKIDKRICDAIAASRSTNRPMSPEIKAAIEEAHKTGATSAVTASGEAVFINYGHDLGDHAHLECTACGGSGHIEDQKLIAASRRIPVPERGEE